MIEKLKQAILKYAEKYGVEMWAEMVSDSQNLPGSIRNEKLLAWQELDILLDETLGELDQLQYLWRRLEPYIPIGPDYVNNFAVGGDGQEGMYSTRAFYEKRRENEISRL
jgi:hypothetical protein